MNNKKHKFITGSDYPKKKILELLNVFGLSVEYDQWDVKGKGWMRIVHLKYPEVGNIILHKDHLEFNANMENETLKSTFQDFLIKIGRFQIKKELNELISLDDGNI